MNLCTQYALHLNVPVATIFKDLGVDSCAINDVENEDMGKRRN